MAKSRTPAKITEPLVDEAYPRKRLYKRLDAARRRPVVWIVGPPGAGKTTLAASYLRARRISYLWYRVDAGDAEASDLFHYLGLAASRGAKKRAASPPRWTGSPATLVPFARRFFEDLFSRLAPSAAIVLDDFQEAPIDSPWHEALREGLATIPRGVNAVIVSRTEPPPAFARRVVAGEVAIVDWKDLRMTEEEATAIARRRAQSWATSAQRDVLAKLCDLADGWAAGLVLLLERAAQGGLDPAPHAGGESQEVFDYFASELFDRTDPAIQRFLLETAFLPNISEHAVQQCAGPAARRILARLRRHDLFVERLDMSDVVYRYHPLFRAFLLDRATLLLDAGELAAARRRAGELLLESGQPEHAFSLFRQANDEPAMAALVQREAPGLIVQGRARTLDQWIACLPEATVVQSGWLSVWQGVCTLGHAPSRSVVSFSRAFDLFAQAGDGFGACVAFSGAVQAISLEGVDLAQLERWLARLDTPIIQSGAPLPPDVALRMATAELVALQSRRPGTPETSRAADRALELSHHATDVGERLMTGALLVMHHAFFEGDLARASVVIDVLREVRRKHEGDPMARVSIRLAEAVYAWACGEDARCLAFVVEGLEIGEAAGVDVWNDRLRAIGAAASLGSGDLVMARTFLAPMAATAASGGQFGIGNYHYQAAWDAFLQDDLARADRSMTIALDAGDALDFPFARSLTRVAKGVLSAAHGRHEEAANWLREARAIAESMGSRFLLHGCLLTEADFAARTDRPEALALLQRGLAVGREGGVFNMFWAPKGMIARLALRALRGKIEVDYVQDLVRRRRARPDAPPVDLESWPWSVRVHTLGELDLRVHGKPVDAGRKAQKVPLRLLKVVIALGGRSVRKERIVTALWPDAEGDAGTQLFDVTLHRLRRLLGGTDAIRLSDGCVHLNPEEVWTDLWAIEEIVSRIDLALRENTDVNPAWVDGVLALQRGPFLASDDEGWALARRERYSEWLVGVMSRLGARFEERDESDRAIALYRRLLDSDSTSEALTQRLMACHLRCDRPSEALRVFNRSRKAVTALGGELSAATLALARQCRANP